MNKAGSMRTAINPGRIEWSGENPGIYLKENADGDYSTLGLFFRVVLSPYGSGTGAIILGEPDTPDGWPNVPNFIIGDNQRLFMWLIEGWVSKMPTFVGRAGLDHMSWIDLLGSTKHPTDLKSKYTESLMGRGIEVQMIWQELGAPLPIELTAANSITKEHEMYAVFLEARKAQIRVNNAPLKGLVTSRQFFGKTMSTAFLALSETWVTPTGKS